MQLFKSIKIFFSLQSFIILSLTAPMALSCPPCPQEKLYISGMRVKENCISVGRYQLYIQEVGKGDPTVIFEAGLGDTSASWDKVLPQVAKEAHTITYDRYKLGRSQTEVEMPQRTAEDAVRDLKTLLNKINARPPYILVGHSFGGLYMQLYAQKYPQEVGGVVLVDSAVRDQSGDEPLPPEDASYYLEAKGRKESLEQAKSAPPFPNIPLLIFTSSQRGKDWLSLQSKLIRLSNQSKQIITEKSGHHIQREEPELISDGIKKMITDIKQVHIAKIINNFIIARNNHDTTAALKLFSDNVIWKTSWGETLHGKEKLKQMFNQQAKDNITNEIISALDIQNDKTFLLRRVTMTSWKKLGINSLVEESEVMIVHDKITYWKSSYTPESAALLQQHKEVSK